MRVNEKEQVSELERAVKRACNRSALFKQVRRIYPNAEAFATLCEASGEDVLKALSMHSMVVKWAILDALSFGLENDLVEMRSASESRS